MKSYQFLLLLVVTSFGTLCLPSCAEDCSGDVKVSGDLGFQESTLSLIGMLDQQELQFVNQDGEAFTLQRTEYTTDFIRMDAGGIICDGGGNADGIYFGEVSRGVFSSDEIEIWITFDAFLDDLINTESEIDISRDEGQDFMEVTLIVPNCDTLSSLRAVQDASSGESTIRISLVPFFKFGQRHETPFRLRGFEYPADMAFTEEKGLVAFNYCGLDWVQIGD